MSTEPRYIIQFQYTDGKPGAEVLARLFRDKGIELDPNFPPVLVNRKDMKYVVRGYASRTSREKAEKSGMHFFSDSKQQVVV